MQKIYIDVEFLSFGNEYQTQEVAIRRPRRRLFTPCHYSFLRREIQRSALRVCLASNSQRKTFIASVVSTHAKTAQWNRKHRANNFAWALLKVHKTPYLFPLVPPLSSYFHPFVLSLRNFFFLFFLVPFPFFAFWILRRIYRNVSQIENEKILCSKEDL